MFRLGSALLFGMALYFASLASATMSAPYQIAILTGICFCYALAGFAEFGGVAACVSGKAMQGLVCALTSLGVTLASIWLAITIAAASPASLSASTSMILLALAMLWSCAGAAISALRTRTSTDFVSSASPHSRSMLVR